MNLHVLGYFPLFVWEGNECKILLLWKGDECKLFRIEVMLNWD